MAGSLNHIVREEDGAFTMEYIETLGDAHEALEECFHIIATLINGDKKKLDSICEALGYPEVEHIPVIYDE